MRTLALLAVVVLAGTGGDITVAYVMKRIARGESWSWSTAPRRVARGLLEPQLYVGIALMGIAFLALITVLSWANVSFVVPATAANHIFGVLGAKLVLKERVTWSRWAGVMLVVAGVALVCAAQSSLL
jgi:bacterial/archaeal transporter family protein